MTHPLCDITTCDVVIRQYLPQIRAELVSRLVKDRGVQQAKVAMWMGLSKATVSQYLSKKRGAGQVVLSKDLDEMIESWADGVIGGEGEITICDICQCIDTDNLIQGQSGT